MNTKSGTGKNYNPNIFERPSVTVDVLIFTIRDEDLKVLLIKRVEWPFKGFWAIPGGFVGIKESLEDAAKRKLAEETGVKNIYLEQLYTFGEPDRDPRTRVITVAYFALVPVSTIKFAKISDNISWFSTKSLPKLAFDHRKIIKYALERIKSKIEYTNIVYSLLPNKFRLRELQKVYETILGHKLDKRNFRKKMGSLGLLEKTGEKEMEGAHRPAMLYKFNKREVIFFD